MSEWTGWIEEIDDDVVTVRFGDNHMCIDKELVPKDLLVLGQYCRIEWCREVWTKEDIERAREEGKKLYSLFGQHDEETK